MKISFFTNMRTPYRTQQIDTIAANTECEIDIYYVAQKTSTRNWKLDRTRFCSESDINTASFFNKIQTIFKIVKNSDVILLGGHEYIDYVIASIFSILLRKKQVLLCDGISAERLRKEKLSFLKKVVKRLLLKNTRAIFGNGNVTKQYFVENWSYPSKNIFNQYLTVDTKEIKKLSKESHIIKKALREKYNILPNKNVIVYCGRLVELKNIKIIIEALAEYENKDGMVFFIIGGGKEQEMYQEYAQEKGVQIVFTGFLPDPKDVYKQYFIGDCFILPSYSESWGLVINEAAAAGLPILCSTHVGASLDFVIEGENGYLFSPYDRREIKEVIHKLFYMNDIKKMGEISQRISEHWTFEDSSKSFNKLIKSIE
ncbi:glycosyltransferase family 4 protein [Peribacillus sp. FSL M8-0224]|uniref:glycosyltransferase family 4 protein n=1 Tax=Peribacillus sp. FSL M8-0224 TaxID=2921568 RepID=UPI0030FC7322